MFDFALSGQLVEHWKTNISGYTAGVNVDVLSNFKVLEHILLDTVYNDRIIPHYKVVIDEAITKQGSDNVISSIIVDNDQSIYATIICLQSLLDENSPIDVYGLPEEDLALGRWFTSKGQHIDPYESITALLVALKAVLAGLENHEIKHSSRKITQIDSLVGSGLDSICQMICGLELQ